jgi:hypothetical protein
MPKRTRKESQDIDQFARGVIVKPVETEKTPLPNAWLPNTDVGSHIGIGSAGAGLK